MENSDNYTLRNRRKRASGSNTEENVGNKRHAHTSVSSNYENKMNKSNEISMCCNYDASRIRGFFRIK